MNITQVTTITDIPYLNTITVRPTSAYPIELNDGDTTGLVASYTVAQVMEMRDALTVAIERVEGALAAPAKPVRLFTPGQIVDADADLPVGTTLKDIDGDTWNVTARGEVVLANFLRGGDLQSLKTVLVYCGPLRILTLPGGES